MGLKIKLIALAIGIGFFFFILRSIQRNRMRPADAVLWLCVSLFLVSVSVLEPAYQWIAGSVIGIVDARHVIYIVLIGFLLVNVFYLTINMNQMADRIQLLLSETAILENELHRALNIDVGQRSQRDEIVENPLD
jgi:hypothetical protein